MPYLNGNEAYFRGARPVSLEEMLSAREARAALQRELLRRFGQPLICFTLAIPGEYKRYPLAERAFREGEALLAQRLEQAGIPALHRQEAVADTGCEGYTIAAAEAGRVKALLIELEERHPLGRLFDLDVLDTDGTPCRGVDHGRKERPCLLCGGPVWRCARSRAHPAEQLALRAAALIGEYFRQKEESADTL